MSKEEILHLATDQMMQGGFDALNFRKISEKLGVSKANIHHHYGSKENLAFQVVSLYANERLSKMKELQIIYQNDFFKFMSELEKSYWDIVESSNNTRICVCSQIISGSDVPNDLLEFSKKHFDEVFCIILDIIKKSSKKFSFKLSPIDMAKQTMIMLNGYMDLAGTYDSVKEAKKNLFGQVKLWAQLYSA